MKRKLLLLGIARPGKSIWWRGGMCLGHGHTPLAFRTLCTAQQSSSIVAKVLSSCLLHYRMNTHHCMCALHRIAKCQKWSHIIMIPQKNLTLIFFPRNIWFVKPIICAIVSKTQVNSLCRIVETFSLLEILNFLEL